MSRSILKEIGKGERIALSKLAVEHLENTGRPFRIAIDAAIWQFQNQAGQGGANPALRTLFYRLLKLLALPIHPVFVYDGKNKPLTKRNKTVTNYGTCLPNELSKKLVQAFRFPHHTAPGEAEAECALLQKKGIVDAVMSQDVDALMFGSKMTLRDWSKEGTRGNKTATHVNVLRAEDVLHKTRLDADGIILVALLSGGDYNPEGIPGFGPGLACEIAKAHFGAELLQLMRDGNIDGLKEWRERLQYELETNESGYFRTKHKTLKIPQDFPDPTILGYYTDPAVSSADQLERVCANCIETWDTDMDIPALRVYVAEKFEWLYRSGAKKLIRTLGPSLLAHRLRRGLKNTTVTTPDSITERRTHFVNDGLPELRLEVVPYDVVGLSLDHEEENPAYVEHENIDDDCPVDIDDANDPSSEVSQAVDDPASPTKRRKSPMWDPFLPEKIWVPETIVKLGVPAFVEAWEQKQRDILADPKKFASRNCVKSKPKPGGMKAGALDSFFGVSKPDTTRGLQAVKVSKLAAKTTVGDRLQTVPMTPSKKVKKARKDVLSPTIDRYLSHSSLSHIAGLDRRKDGTAGLQLPHKARYSALGLYGSDAQSSDVGELLLSSQCSNPAVKHSRPTSSQSTAITDESSGNTTISCADLNHRVSRKIAGASIQESIMIDSSPPTSPTTPLDPIPNATVQGEPDSVFPSTQIPSSVAQRSKRRTRARITPPPPQPTPAIGTSNASLPRPQVSQTRTKRVSRTKSPTSTSTSASAPLVPPTLTTGLKTHFTATKSTVLSRDSLPGTWKEVDEDVVVAAGRTRPPRVSCLDLTDV